MRSRVLIVGAGPTGLLLAAELARRGVTAMLIDAHDAPLGWDRATVVHARSLELFESFGILDRFLDAGTPIRRELLYAGGAKLGELDLAESGSRYGFDLGLSENVTESILTEYLESHGASVTRGARLVGLTTRAERVTAVIERAAGTEEITADWVIGCDGFHSPTRTLAHIPFPGHELAAPWAVFDCTLRGWTGGFDANVGLLDEPVVILTALPDERWRIYLRPSAPEADLIGEAQTAITRYAPSVSIVDQGPAVRFECHTRVASRYRAGRVLLAGDAAHVCTPAEGHGMNTGLQDAVNLAWKLALICGGSAGPTLLDSYEPERRPVAVAVGESGDRVEASEMVSDASARTARNDALRAAFTDPDARHREAVATAELAITYAGSPIVGGDANTVLGPGDRIPDTPDVHARGEPPRPLSALCHRAGHTLLLLGRAATGSEVAAAVAAVTPTVAGSALVDAVFGLSVDDGAPDPAGYMTDDVADRVGVEGSAMLLVRPDGYVAFRHDALDPSMLSAYLARIVANPTASSQP